MHNNNNNNNNNKDMPKDYLFAISKNSVQQFWRRRFSKVLQTETKFLHFSIFKVLPKCL